MGNEDYLFSGLEIEEREGRIRRVDDIVGARRRIASGSIIVVEGAKIEAKEFTRVKIIVAQTPALRRTVDIAGLRGRHRATDFPSRNLGRREAACRRPAGHIDQLLKTSLVGHNDLVAGT